MNNYAPSSRLALQKNPSILFAPLFLIRDTGAFPDYALQRGNDLVTPVPEYDFPGLKPGDRWCVCAQRWLEAAEDGVAPPVILDATHAHALRKVSLAGLQYHALRAPEVPHP